MIRIAPRYGVRFEQHGYSVYRINDGMTVEHYPRGRTELDRGKAMGQANAHCNDLNAGRIKEREG